MRKAACDGDFKEFCAMSALKNKESNANLFDEIRRMMGCESLKETRMNTHQTHFEDLVCYGSEGLDELNDKIRKYKQRTNKRKNLLHINYLLKKSSAAHRRYIDLRISSFNAGVISPSSMR